jgi:haloacetate dehalogenase
VSELFAGFDTIDMRVDSGVVHARTAGSGPPVLLLHGWPQTHAMWHELAPALARDYTVVAADIRGYGDSRADEPDFTFRAMAADARALMAGLGHERFHLVGHDRGARVAHRMALDHTGSVRSVALLDILPTLEVWRLMNDWLMLRYYHWAFLAQPGGLPERLIGHDPVDYLRRTLRALGGSLEMFHPAALAEYERAAGRPESVVAWCGDYRAAVGPDLEHDRADAGRAVDVPALVLWGDRGVVDKQEDPLVVWRRYFPSAHGGSVAAGHCLVEERPDEVLSAVRAHLDASG